jgi:DNA polymerase-3 subunit delta'
MPVPATDIALQWLQSQGLTENPAQRLSYAGGSPLSVLNTARESVVGQEDTAKMLAQGSRLDPFVAAPLCLVEGMEMALHALQKWTYDLLAVRLVDNAHYHSGHASALQALSKSVDLPRLLDFQQKLNEARRSATHPLNNELQMESLLLQYTQLFTTKTN